MKLLIRLVISTASVLLAAYLIPGVEVPDIMTGFVVAIVLGLLNAFVKPILTILTLPITLLTMGLFMFVINTIMVILASYVVPGFEITGILAAFLFSLLVSFLNSFLGQIAK